MQTINSKIEEVLNHLIDVCHDSGRTFEIAANAVHEATLRMELLRYSRQRGEFLTDLRGAVEELGQIPEAHGSLPGAMRRGWMNVTKVLPGDTEHAILSACEREEDAVLDAYRQAVDAELPGSVGDLIAAQFRVIHSMHERIRSLRDASNDCSSSKHD